MVQYAPVQREVEIVGNPPSTHAIYDATRPPLQESRCNKKISEARHLEAHPLSRGWASASDDPQRRMPGWDDPAGRCYIPVAADVAALRPNMPRTIIERIAPMTA